MTNILIIAKGSNSQILNDFFSSEKEFTVIGIAQNKKGAEALLSTCKKAFVIFDYNEDMESVFQDCLKSIQSNNAKVIAICDNVKQGFELLGKGADDICIRLKVDGINERRSFFMSLSGKIRKIVRDSGKGLRVLKNKYENPIDCVIVLGSSTGGTECVLQILKAMPAEAPPILVVQHMPPVFTSLYSQRLHGECAISVWEARDGDTLENGLALIAPGDKQMRLNKKNNKYIVNCTVEKPVSGHMPSVDVLFHSVAKLMPQKAIGIILTGMGKDGAEGLLAMRAAGACTLGQDEKSSIVYGMPKAAYDINAVIHQGNPGAIINRILAYI